MSMDHDAEIDATCRYGTHAPRDCPARVFALSGTTPPSCPIAPAECEGTTCRYSGCQGICVTSPEATS